jgi:homogentisate 1,2-dioxygenase
MTPHGPDKQTFEKASEAPAVPEKYGNTLAFMFESSYILYLTPFALENQDVNYSDCWQGLDSHFVE